MGLGIEVFGSLNTDKDPAQLGADEAVVCQDIDTRDGKARKLPGVADKFDSLPSGFTPYDGIEHLFTKPSEKQVTLLYGKDGSSNDQLWVRPYVDAGSWVDDWLELTEKETGTAGSGTNTTTIIAPDTDLPGTASDYYKGFIVINTDRSNTRALVTASSESGGNVTLTLKTAIASQASGDAFIVLRMPVFDEDGNILFDPMNDKVRFVPRLNGIEILTGSADNIFNDNTDLLLTYINSDSFDDSDLSINKLWLSVNNLPSVHLTSIGTLSAQAETDDPVPAEDYIVVVVALFDGYQEGGFYGPDVGNEKNLYLTGRITVSTNERIRLAMSYAPEGDSSQLHALVYDSVVGSENFALYHDFRITKFLIYMAEADEHSTLRDYPVEAFRMVKEVEVDSADWSGTGPYTQNIEIYGSTYTLSAGETREFRTGNDSRTLYIAKEDKHFLTSFANAEFSAFVGRQRYLGNVYIDEQREDVILQTPINSDDVNTPDVKAWSIRIETSPYGIARIIGMMESLGRLVVFGENRILRIVPSPIGPPRIEETYVEKGATAKEGFAESNGIIYFCGMDNIYAFRVVDAALYKITERGGKGGIRETWQGFTESQRQSAKLGYDRRRNCLLLRVASSHYVYWIDKDQWGTYSGLANNADSMFTGIDGELYVIDSAGSVVECFASSPETNTQMHYKTGIINEPVRVLKEECSFEGTDKMTLDMYDEQFSNTYPRAPQTLFTKKDTGKQRVERYTSCEFERLQLELKSASSSNTDNVIESLKIEAEKINDK